MNADKFLTDKIVVENFNVENVENYNSNYEYHLQQ